jgi:PhzF family phenazine biosynthesis protein
MTTMNREFAGLPLYHVDAFTEKPFAGNPAAICILNDTRPAAWMQSVAAEMNLSETAFIRRLGTDFELRWFTPTTEVDLCGHATLASAHVMWGEGFVREDESVRFQTKSGTLTCSRAAGAIEMDFPAIPIAEELAPPSIIDALGIRPTYTGGAKFFYLFLVESEGIVRALQPNFDALRSLAGMRGVIVTSPSTDPRFDFVSRFFGPGAGIDEDPVTGSAHCCLAPFWSERLGKPAMTGFQASRRGGIVHARLANDRIILGGNAITVTRGELLA